MPGYDNYEWTVVVLRQRSGGDWLEVSDPPPVRAFYWAKPEKPSEGKKKSRSPPGGHRSSWRMRIR
jgi:hypothetical protein